jgi:hypothetical protein
MAKMPLWVALAFSSVRSRKLALYIVYGCAAFTAYCVPWPHYFGDQTWVTKIFLLDDWSWAVMMIPTTIWYWLSFMWIERNSTWEIPE